MALKNNKENYLRIASEDINTGAIDYEVYKNQDSRVNGLGEFEKTEQHRFVIPINLDVVALADAENPKTIKQHIRTQSYVALKTLPEFEGWVDC